MSFYLILLRLLCLDISDRRNCYELNLPIPLTLSGLGGGGGGGEGLRCLDDQLKFAIQKLPILRMMSKYCDFCVFIFKTCSDQILAKLINLGGCCCSFPIKRSKNLQNEKNSSTWKLLKLTRGGGSILGQGK